MLRRLHLKHPDGFDEEMFRRFEAGCRVWSAYVHAVLKESLHQVGEVEYQIGPATLSEDRTIASLTIQGEWSVGARAHFEDAGSFLLREFMLFPFALGLMEGLEEERGEGEVSWRSAYPPSSSST